jgi:hypothetical protein
MLDEDFSLILNGSQVGGTVPLLENAGILKELTRLPVVDGDG